MAGEASAQGIRTDVRTLSDALAIDNQLASAALNRARALKTKLSKATEYTKSLSTLNEFAERRSTDVLTGDNQAATPLGLSQQWATDLHDDNTQLRATLSKFQSAIDLIMQKHRTQVSQFMDNAKKLQSETDAKVKAVEDRNTELEQQTSKQASKIEEMLQVMCLAVVEDTKTQSVRDTEIQRLRTENQGLRQLLETAGMQSCNESSAVEVEVAESAA